MIFTPEGPSTNIIRTMGFYIGNCYYDFGQVLLICEPGPLGYFVVAGSSVRYSLLGYLDAWKRRGRISHSPHGAAFDHGSPRATMDLQSTQTMDPIPNGSLNKLGGSYFGPLL